MKSICSGAAIIAIALVSSAPLTGSACAETISYTLALKGSEEVPPTNSKGIGAAEIYFDTATKQLKWKVTYSGLTGPAIMGHIHGPAEPGKNAPVVVPFGSAAASPIEGSATLTDAQAADLMAGKWYVNIHTAENKGGEIRGQVLNSK
jgi:CHRD domain